MGIDTIHIDTATCDIHRISLIHTYTFELLTHSLTLFTVPYIYNDNVPVAPVTYPPETNSASQLD